VIHFRKRPPPGVRIITFDDLHETGVFSWAYLYRLDVEHAKR
jgi:DUF971 family protein